MFEIRTCPSGYMLIDMSDTLPVRLMQGALCDVWHFFEILMEHFGVAGGNGHQMASTAKQNIALYQLEERDIEFLSTCEQNVLVKY